MLNFTLRRILVAIPIFFGVTVIAFTIATFSPDGGLLASFVGPGKHVSAQYLLEVEHRLHMDQPGYIRYFYWLWSLLHGDLGTSVLTHHQVLYSISQRIAPTLMLTGSAFIIAECVAIPSGILSAIKRNSIFDQIFTVVSYVLFAMPTFWFGLMAIVIIGVELQWLPFGGLNDVRVSGSFGTSSYWTYFHANTIPAILDLVSHLAMPVLVLSMVSFAGDSRFMRGQMLGVLSQDYIRTARAKGLTSRVVIWKHAVRNALLPVVTNIGLAIPGLIGGAIVTESIFGISGMGQFYIQAAVSQDYPVVIAYTILIGGLVLIFNILTDITYAFVDPRIRLD